MKPTGMGLPCFETQLLVSISYANLSVSQCSLGVMLEPRRTQMDEDLVRETYPVTNS